MLFRLKTLALAGAGMCQLDYRRSVVVIDARPIGIAVMRAGLADMYRSRTDGEFRSH